MRLVWLSLRDVRSYRDLVFAPLPDVNVLIGDNGSGKTTVLEGIGYLASLRSIRRAPDASLVREGAEAAVIRGEFQQQDRSIRVEIEIPASGRRRILLNGKRPAGRAAVVSQVRVVAFLPDDLDLVKRGPAYRREFLDDLTAGLRPSAAADQDSYDRAVRQRNALLRKEGRSADPVTLGVFDERIAALGAAVIEWRLRLLAELAPALESIVADLDGARHAFGWWYEAAGPGRLEPEAERGALELRLAEALRAARHRDLEQRATTVGPHRDEIVLTLAGRDVRTRASQGEQRSVALGLRVAASELLSRRGDSPVLLLDDVFSELDAGRSARLVERLPEGQIFVTSAREDEVPVPGCRWDVVEGSVMERSG